jgi:DnaJ-class molecular chaperone
MFVDYYELFEIEADVSQETIKAAFRKQALKWHPDRNQHTDTTKQMQLLNEAYLILKDPEARVKYDKEYHRYKQFNKEKTAQEENQTKKTAENQQHQKDDKKDDFSSFKIEDDILEKWIKNARRQAVELAKQTIKDLKGMSYEGLKEGAKGAGTQLFYQLLISFIFFILIGLIGTCSG